MGFQWVKRWLERLLDRRACPRIVTPLVAHYWDGGATQAHPVKNVSAEGAYILTGTRWYPGTIVDMTLQYDPHYLRVAGIAGDPNAALVFRAKVVRFGPDGVGVQFLYLSKERERFEKFIAEAHARAEDGGYPGRQKLIASPAQERNQIANFPPPIRNARETFSMLWSVWCSWSDNKTVLLANAGIKRFIGLPDH
jgi:hypothetical protein